MKSKFLLERILTGKGKSRELKILYEMLQEFLPIIHVEGVTIRLAGTSEHHELLTKDASLRQFFREVSVFNQDPQFIAVKKEMTTVLKDTKLTEVNSSYLPDNFSGYFELNDSDIKDEDGDTIQGFVANFKRHEAFYYMGVSVLVKSPEGGIRLAHITLDPKESKAMDIKTLAEHYPFVYTRTGSNGELETVKEKGRYPEYLNLLINLVIYASYESLPLKHNEFIGSRNAIETQRHIYSEVPYKIIGEGFSVPKTYSVDSTEVRGHFRWQRHGEGFSLLKYIYIEPHIRNYGASLL